MKYNSKKVKTSLTFLLRLFLIVIVSIFCSEYLIMLFIHPLFLNVSSSTFALIDSIILVIVVTPIVFIFLFRPLLGTITELKTKEAELESSKENLETQIAYRTSSLITLNESLEQEISDRIIAEKTLLTMADDVSVKTGGEFFESLVRYLSLTIRVKYAFIGELLPDDTINTISVYASGQIGDNFSYALADTPCSNVIGKEFCIYKSGIREQFPKDNLLVEMGAESYGGIPLFSSDGAPLGIIAVLDERPFEETKAYRLKYILQIIGARAASELERLRMELTLFESEERYRTIFEAAGMSLVIVDENLNIILTNDNFRLLTGYSDLEGKRNFTELCGLEYKNLIQNYNDRIIKSPKSVSENMESVIITSDGRELTVTVTIALMPNQMSRIISVLDITEKQKLHDEAVRAAHLASLGGLAAGVAHEINNPINTVLLNAQHAVRNFKLDEEQMDSIEQIIKESNRISNIVKSLLSFARHEVDVKNTARISDALDSALSITEHLFRKDGCTIINKVSADLPEVFVNISQIEQVFVNILINARHALNQKYPEPSDEKIIEINNYMVNINSKEYIRTVFCDYGIGMPEDIIEKAMNPFFTTKESGTGTGLGLSISHGLILDNGGTLILESSSGDYTKVTIDLPLKGETDEQ